MACFGTKEGKEQLHAKAVALRRYPGWISLTHARNAERKRLTKVHRPRVFLRFKRCDPLGSHIAKPDLGDTPYEGTDPDRFLAVLHVSRQLAPRRVAGGADEPGPSDVQLRTWADYANLLWQAAVSNYLVADANDDYEFLRTLRFVEYLSSTVDFLMSTAPDERRASEDFVDLAHNFVSFLISLAVPVTSEAPADVVEIADGTPVNVVQGIPTVVDGTPADVVEIADGTPVNVVQGIPTVVDGTPADVVEIADGTPVIVVQGIPVVSIVDGTPADVVEIADGTPVIVVQGIPTVVDGTPADVVEIADGTPVIVVQGIPMASTADGTPADVEEGAEGTPVNVVQGIPTVVDGEEGNVDDDGDTVMEVEEPVSRGRGSKRRSWESSYDEEVSREREAKRRYGLRSTRAREQRMSDIKKAADAKRKGVGEAEGSSRDSGKRSRR